MPTEAAEVSTPIDTITQYLMEQDAPREEVRPDPDAEPGEERLEAKPEDVEEVKEEDKPADDEALEIDPEAKIFDLDGEKVSLNDIKAQKAVVAQSATEKAQLAQERDALAQRAQSIIQEQRSAYTKELEALKATVWQTASSELSGVNWSKLAEENPAEWARLYAKAQDLNQTIASVEQKIQLSRQQEQQETAQHRQQEIAESVQYLTKAIPGWNDEVYTTTMKKGVEFFGLEPAAVSSETKGKLIHILHDAVKYRELMSGKQIAEKKVVDAPRMLKPGAAQPVSDSAKTDLSRLKARLKATGSKAAGAALIERLLQGK